jgi:hypothetical protein
VAWGGITGTLSSQTDLQTTLDLKANLTGTSAFSVVGSTIRSLDASDNFTQLNGNALQFGNLATGVGGLTVYGTGITFADSTVQTTAAVAGVPEAPIDGSQYARKDAAWEVVTTPADFITSVTSPLSVTSGDLSVDLSAYSTTAVANGLYYPLSGNPSGFLTSAPVTSVAGRTGAITLANTDISGLGTMATATATDYLAKAGNLSGLASQPTSRTNLGLGTLAVVDDAPSDSKAYVRQNAAWLALVSDIPDFAWYDHPPAAWSTNVANSGIAAVASVNCHNLVTSVSVANSRASVFTTKNTGTAAYVGQFYGNGAFARYRLNWSKKLALFSAFNDAAGGLAINVDYWCAIGLPSTGAFVGTFTDKGMGIHINTTAANVAQIRIIYHDGTTQKASSYVSFNTVQANNVFANNSWSLFSDGTGTIKLFCYSNVLNGLAITVTDGPTGISATNHNVNIGASILTGATASNNTITMVQPRVYYGL